MTSTDMAAIAAVLAPACLFTVLVFCFVYVVFFLTNKTSFVYVVLGLIYSGFSGYSLVLLF